LGAESLAIFGSCARNEQRPGSDIDVIVRLRPSFGYFDLGEIQSLLESDSMCRCARLSNPSYRTVSMSVHASMSSEYDGNDPKQRLNDIATDFR